VRDEGGEVFTLLRQLGTDESDRAWESFIDAYGAILYQVVHHLERHPDSARDCFVYVCEQLAADRFRRLRKYGVHEKATFSTWLRCVARNLCVDWRRSNSGRQRSFKVIQGLTRLEQRVYQSHFVDRTTVRQTTALLRSEFPAVDDEEVTRIVERIYSMLSSRQLWLLTAHSRRIEELDAPGRAVARELADGGASPEDRLLGKERHERLAGSLGRLSGPELRLLKLRFEEERSLRVCADALGLGSPQKADRMLQALLARLRATLLG